MTNIVEKPKLYIFDLDGCIANSDDFILTNEQAYAKDPGLTKRPGIGYRGELTNDIKHVFSEAYLIDHQLEIPPYKGILDLFVRMAQTSHAAIVTARTPLLRYATIAWLERTISLFYSKQEWRRLSYKLIFNEFNEKSIVYKKRTIEELKETYDIALIIDDHPEIAEYAKSNGLVCLVPATGYKNLNGCDLMTTSNKCLAKEPIKRKKVKNNDNMQKKQKATSKAL